MYPLRYIFQTLYVLKHLITPAYSSREKGAMQDKKGEALHPSWGNWVPVGARVARSGGVGLYGRPLLLMEGDPSRFGAFVHSNNFQNLQ
jgi:hypothetical protein